jgi:hypothetical protein
MGYADNLTLYYENEHERLFYNKNALIAFIE